MNLSWWRRGCEDELSYDAVALSGASAPGDAAAPPCPALQPMQDVTVEPPCIALRPRHRWPLPLQALAAGLLAMVTLPAAANADNDRSLVGRSDVRVAMLSGPLTPTLPSTLLRHVDDSAESPPPNTSAPTAPVPATQNIVAPAATAAPPANPEQIDRLRDHYRAQVATGDGTAAMELGKTYDPRYLSSDVDGHPDPGLAEKWYRLGAALGNQEAATLLHADAKLSPP